MDNINLDKVFETYNKLLHWPEKETGTSFFYKCPYHQEKTSSFAVKKDNGIFKCFWCWKSWNIITLIKDHFSWQQNELFQFLWLWYNGWKNKRNFNVKDYIKKEIINTLPSKIEQRLDEKNIMYLKGRWFTREFISKYNFFNLNNNIINKVIEKGSIDLWNRLKDVDNKDKQEEIKKYNNKLLKKYKDFLEKQSKYYNDYLIIPTAYKNNFTNNYMFIWRNISSKNWPRYKNEQLNKNWKTFWIWKNNDNIITIMEWSIDWMIYNNFTNKTVNLLLGANKMSYENKIITFLTDNDQAWFDFLWNLYDFDSMFYNNNINYIFWAISYKELFKNFFLKYISDKYQYDIESEIFINIINWYWKIIEEIKDLNELYKFLIKLLFITEQTLGKNNTENFLEQVGLNEVLTLGFNEIPYDFIERKDIQKDISEFVNIFDKANIEQNTFIIFFFYYNILKNRVDLLDNIDFQFFIDKLKDQDNISDIVIENIKKILIKRNPYFIMSAFLYYFWIENFIKISNLLLYKTNNKDKIEKNIVKEFLSFVKTYKIILLQSEILYLLKKVDVITDKQYKQIIINIENQSVKVIENDNVDYWKILKSKMYYWRIFIIPLIYSLFNYDEKSKNILSNLIAKDNKDILNLIGLMNNINKSNIINFSDIKKINDLKSVFQKFINKTIWEDFKIANIWKDFLNIFWLDQINNLSEISYIIEQMNKNDIEENIELMWLGNLLRLRSNKDINSYVDKYNIDNQELKENIADTLNDLNKDNKEWNKLTIKTDESIILNMIQNNKERINKEITEKEDFIKLNKIILGILQSFIMYI